MPAAALLVLHRPPPHMQRRRAAGRARRAERRSRLLAVTEACRAPGYQFHGEAAELTDGPGQAEEPEVEEGGEDPEAAEYDAEVGCGQPSLTMPAEPGVRCLADRCMPRRTHPNPKPHAPQQPRLRPGCGLAPCSCP